MTPFARVRKLRLNCAKRIGVGPLRGVRFVIGPPILNSSLDSKIVHLTPPTSDLENGK